MVINVKPSNGGGWETFLPSAYKWGLQDISSPASGRTLDGMMHKERVAQKRKLELSFWGLKKSETARVLQAFNPEYIDVEFEDAMTGEREVRTFYTGDKTAPVWTWTVDNKIYEKISFNLIER